MEEIKLRWLYRRERSGIYKYMYVHCLKILRPITPTHKIHSAIAVPHPPHKQHSIFSNSKYPVP